MGQELFTKLSNRLANRFSIDSSGMTTTDWVVANTTLNGKPFSIDGYEFQRAIMDDDHRNMSCIKCSQVGLALALDTPIPTPRGWSTMGDLVVGDKVYDEQGRICNVTYVSPIYENHKCYEVEFDDGSKIVADENHRWLVTSARSFDPDGNPRPVGQLPKNAPTYECTRVLKTSQLLNGSAFYVANCTPLEGVNELPVDPYFLGAWLGDGSCKGTDLTGETQDLEVILQELKTRGLVSRELENRGGVVKAKLDYPSGRGGTLYSQLTALGVREKHIPKEYLRASAEDRWDLLRGLMDTDGSCTKKGRCKFHNTNPQLVKDVEELLHSLGFKTATNWKKPSPGRLVSGRVIQGVKLQAEVHFSPYSDQKIFYLPRKQARIKSRERGHLRQTTSRKIISVVEVASVPVRCITVDSPNHLYLAGWSMIPTHNTELQIRSTLSLLIRREGTSAIFSLPTEDMYERVSKARIKPIIDHDSVFNTSRDRLNKSVRTSGMMQFGNSYLYIVAATETAATSVPADAVINDELDLSDQKMIALFNSRMQNSTLKLNRKFSTPTFPGHGIDLHWQHSDQHHYLVKCECCNHWQHPEFNRSFIHLPGLSDNIEDLSQIDSFIASSINLRESYVKCEKCGNKLNLVNPELRQWVPFFASRVNSRGFRVSPFCTSKLDVGYIVQQLLEYRKAEYVRGWWNTVLGLPYSDSSIQIPIGAIRECMKSPGREEPSEGDPVFIGIDMGQTCHIVLGRSNEGKHIFHFETVHVDNLLGRVNELLQKYNIVAGAIDRYPYTPTSNEVFELSGGKIVPVEYAGNSEVTLAKDAYGEMTHAQVNRTMCLDHVMTSIKKHEVALTGYGEKKQVIEDHLRDMVRDESPDQKVKWVKLNNNDHFFHAVGYLLVSPKIIDLVRYKDDTDQREMSVIHELGVGMDEKPDPRTRGLFNNSMDTTGIIGYRY